MTSFKMTAAVLVAGGLAASAAAQDWPQWRGPNRDGVVVGFRAPASWPSTLQQQWKIEIGTGYATPLAIGNRVYTFTREGTDEVVRAIDAPSGKVLWRSAYPAPFTLSSAAARHGPGPKSTPAFSGNRLFTLGMSGIVTAFDAGTGRRIWQKPAPAVQPMYHTGMSPVVDAGVVIFHVGGHDDGALTAFDVATGDVRWRWDGDGPAYSSPLVADLPGGRQVVTFTQRYFVGVAMGTGQLLWRRPYTTQATTTSQTPILHNGMVIEMGRGNGVTAFRVAQSGNQWTTQDVWHTDEVSMHLSDAVVIDGVLFGLSHLNSGQYFALDLDSGRVLWRSEPRQAEHAAIARSGATIVSLEDDSELVVIRHSRTNFDPVARYTVATSATWSQPVLSGNRIFVKDVSSLTLWTVD
jgi:outer membrane protein assembly factor BamB